MEKCFVFTATVISLRDGQISVAPKFASEWQRLATKQLDASKSNLVALLSAWLHNNSGPTDCLPPEKTLPTWLNGELLDWRCPFLFKAAATAKGSVLMVLNSNDSNLLELRNTRRPGTECNFSNAHYSPVPNRWLTLEYGCFRGFSLIRTTSRCNFSRTCASKFPRGNCCGLRDSGFACFLLTGHSQPARWCKLLPIWARKPENVHYWTHKSNNRLPPASRKWIRKIVPYFCFSSIFMKWITVPSFLHITPHSFTCEGQRDMDLPLEPNG